MTQTDHIRDELRKAESLLSTADYLTREGRLVSIAALKDMVAAICSGVAEAGYEECGALKAPMSEFMRRLDDFKAELEKRYGFSKPAAPDGE